MSEDLSGMCPYQLIEEQSEANQRLIATCEDLIARLEKVTEAYNSIVPLANTLAVQAQKWQKKANDYSDRNEQLIQGMQLACKIYRAKHGANDPIYFQLQGYLNEGI